MLTLNGKRFGLVIVDDYSRFSWIFFIFHKNEAFDKFLLFFRRVQMVHGAKVAAIQTDHGDEFKNNSFDEFCDEQGIKHQYSSPRTPEQNGVVERKNRVLIEMARTMLAESGLPKKFWAEAINTACHILNRVMVRPILNRTPYELLKGKKPNVSYFKPFRVKCFIYNNNKKI